MLKNVPISERYSSPLWRALIHSGIMAITLQSWCSTSTATAQLSGIGLSIFWAWVFVAIWRRPQNPTSLDLLLIRWGYLRLSYSSTQSFAVGTGAIFRAVFFPHRTGRICSARARFRLVSAGVPSLSRRLLIGRARSFYRRCGSHPRN